MSNQADEKTLGRVLRDVDKAIEDYFLVAIGFGSGFKYKEDCQKVEQELKALIGSLVEVKINQLNETYAVGYMHGKNGLANAPSNCVDRIINYPIPEDRANKIIGGESD